MKRAAYVLACLFVAACSGGGSGSPPRPVPTATPVATPTPTPTTVTPTPSPTPTGTATQTAFTCPSSDSAASFARSAGGLETVVRRMPLHGREFALSPNLLAVTYASSYASGFAGQIASREQRSGATFVHSLSFWHAGLVTRIVRVDPRSLDAAAAALRAQPGVRSVERTGARRSKLSVNAGLITNDPYFAGFGVAAPLYETASSPGQWDKHVVRLEDAFAFSQPSNGSNVHNANALGSASVKIAIIDTGEDSTHPELASKIAYQKCYISDTSGNQSTSNFETDPVGHGTDVSGIAAAATNNSIGFAGSGGNAAIYGYRVFPTPDDNCVSDNTNDAQCSASTIDIASAIEDAVSQHVNVISISLGGGGCSNGTDGDPIEGNAIADAIAANIVVVAASGNGNSAGVGQPSLSAPACDTGVIAAGATSLADGQPNGTGSATGSASAPNEYVASYSNYGSPGSAANSANAWGIVAPGGDPAAAEASCMTTGCIDDLHWIENIWTSTPFDTNFSGNCMPDHNATNSTADCRTLIAGTSMSTPAVAGAAALILAVNASFQSPSAMKTLLCHTADDIGDPHEGCGRLDVYRAMATALGDSSPPGARPVP